MMKKVFLVLAIASVLIGCKKKSNDEIKPDNQSMLPTSMETFYEGLSSKSKSDFTYKNGKIFSIERYLDTGTGYMNEASYLFNFDGNSLKKINMTFYRINRPHGLSYEASNSSMYYTYNYNYNNDGSINLFKSNIIYQNKLSRSDSIWYVYDGNSQLKYFINNIFSASTNSYDLDSVSVNKSGGGSDFSYSYITYKKSQSNPDYTFSKKMEWIIDAGKKTLTTCEDDTDTTLYKFSNQNDILADFNYVQYGMYGILICPELKKAGLNTYLLEHYTNFQNPIMAPEPRRSDKYNNDVYSDEYGRVIKVVQWATRQGGSRVNISTTNYHY